MDREAITVIASVLTAQRGTAVSEGDVALALMDVDLDAAKREAQSRVTWESWDKVMPINGVEADYFLSREDYGGGEVYLVRLDGQVIMVQPHVPGIEGVEPISADDVETFASEQVSAIVGDLSFAEIVDRVSRALLPSVLDQAPPIKGIQPPRVGDV